MAEKDKKTSITNAEPEIVADKTIKPEIVSKERVVEIDGKSYVIEKFKFGKQLKLAGIVAGIFKAMNIDMKDIGSDDKGKKSSKISVNLDLSILFKKFSDECAEILALGLNIPVEKAQDIENGEEAIKALQDILDLNPVGDLLGKSMTLLKSIDLS